MTNDSEHNYIEGSSAVEIARSVEEAIVAGRVAPGARLPTVRKLAQQLGVSPATVSAAFRSLRDRGLLVAQGRRGTRVADRPPVSIALTSVRRAPAGTRDLASGNPDPALLPDLGPALRSIETSQHLYGEAAIDPQLHALARASFEASGIGADAITVTSGAMDAIERALQAHLRPGDRVAVEDPGFVGVLQLLPALGLAPVPVAIDDAGPQPESLERALREGVSAFILTPRAQNPMGSCLDEDRAGELRAILARHPEVLLIEDDHAGRAAGAPALTLSVAGPRHWLSVRSVSKVYGPDLRLAIATGDATSIARIEGRQLVGARWVSFLLQRTVAALWRDRALDTALERAAATYAERRGALVESLARHGIASHGRSGLNVWVPVREEASIVQGLLERGWAVTAGEIFRLRSGPALRVTTASLEPAEAEAFAADLAGLLRPSGRTLSA